MNSSRIGDWAELVATSWLLQQGYEVFRNVSSVGPVDLVAMKPGETLKIDVKIFSSSYAKDRRTDAQKQLDVRYLLVTHEGACYWTTEEYYAECLSRPS